MPLDFPNAPSVGQEFRSGNVAWRWDGVKWSSFASPLAGDAVVNSVTVSRNAGITTGPNRAISTFLNYFGTYTGGVAQGLAANTMNITADNVDTGAANLIDTLYVGHSFGGATVTGHRTGATMVLTCTAPTGNSAVGRANFSYYVGLSLFSTSSANNVNGTKEQIFSANFLAVLGGTNSFYNQVVGLEQDIQVNATNSCTAKQGMKVVYYGNDAVAGTLSDYAYGMGRSSTTSPGAKIGYALCSYDGYWPINTTTGICIGSENPLGGGAKQANCGVKFDDITFLTAAFASPGFKVDGTGRVTLNLTNATNDAAAASAGVPLNTLYRNGSVVMFRVT